MTSLLRVLSLAAALMALTGCAVFEKKKEPPPCPTVSILRDGARLTRFRPGPGRDITDVQLEAEFLGYQGSCQYDEENKVMSVTMQVKLGLQRGPGAEGRKTELAYFVAMPAFYPAPQAKLVVPVAVEFPGGSDRVRYTDDEVSISFPLKDLKQLPKYEVFLGLQLSPEEAEYNRALLRH